MAQPSVIAGIDAILAEMATRPDVELGGPAASSARENANLVAEQLRGMAKHGIPLPRHGGSPAPGKLASLISDMTGKRFNRQLFSSNDWCARLLALYVEWEAGSRPTALATAQAAAESKEITSRREGALEEEVLLLRVENRELRQELVNLRGFMATTGRMP